MTRTHINKTLIALDDKINAISARIKEISEEIHEGMQNACNELYIVDQLGNCFSPCGDMMEWI